MVEHARSKHYLVGYQEIKCHMAFDIKVDNLVRKVCFAASGHTTETLATMTYSSVVSRDSARIASFWHLRKARFVASGHTAETLLTMTYSSVVTCDSSCIASSSWHLWNLRFGRWMLAMHN
jgi:hypothetical protein